MKDEKDDAIFGTPKALIDSARISYTCYTFLYGLMVAQGSNVIQHTYGKELVCEALFDNPNSRN